MCCYLMVYLDVSLMLHDLAGMMHRACGLSMSNSGSLGGSWSGKPEIHSSVAEQDHL